jgi:hypothetical protein
MENFLSLQEIFDKSAQGLLKQGCQSTDEEGNCRYRGENGTKCAGGFLMDDEHFSKEIEGLSINAFNDVSGPSDKNRDRSLLVKSILEKSRINTASDTVIYLCKRLQFIHDDNYAEDWHEKLKILAEHFGLEMKFDSTGNFMQNKNDDAGNAS